MAFGIYMLVNSGLRPPCTQFETEMDWEMLIQAKDKPKPYLIMVFGIMFITLMFVIGIKIRHQRISIVMPLNQPRDLESLFLIAYSMIIILIIIILKHKQ